MRRTKNRRTSSTPIQFLLLLSVAATPEGWRASALCINVFLFLLSACTVQTPSFILNALSCAIESATKCGCPPGAYICTSASTCAFSLYLNSRFTRKENVLNTQNILFACGVKVHARNGSSMWRRLHGVKSV